MQARGCRKRKKKLTIDGANGETQPAVLVSVQNEEDDKVRNGR